MYCKLTKPNEDERPHKPRSHWRIKSFLVLSDLNSPLLIDQITVTSPPDLLQLTKTLREGVDLLTRDTRVCSQTSNLQRPISKGHSTLKRKPVRDTWGSEALRQGVTIYCCLVSSELLSSHSLYWPPNRFPKSSCPLVARQDEGLPFLSVADVKSTRNFFLLLDESHSFSVKSTFCVRSLRNLLHSVSRSSAPQPREEATPQGVSMSLNKQTNK